MAVHNLQFFKWNNEPAYSPATHIETKFYYFGGPHVNKDIISLQITGTGNGSILVSYRTNQANSNYTHWGNGSFLIDDDNTNFELTIPAPYVNVNTIPTKQLQKIKGIGIKIQWATSLNKPLVIDDISIMYRQYREISVDEDDT